MVSPAADVSGSRSAQGILGEMHNHRIDTRVEVHTLPWKMWKAFVLLCATALGGLGVSIFFDIGIALSFVRPNAWYGMFISVICLTSPVIWMVLMQRFAAANKKESWRRLGAMILFASGVMLFLWLVWVTP